jgi:hypothetical protein
MEKPTLDSLFADIKKAIKKNPAVKDYVLHHLMTIKNGRHSDFLSIPFRFRKAWERFYLDIFRMKVSFKDTKIPKSDKKKNLTYPVLIAKGIDRDHLGQVVRDLLGYRTIRSNLNVLLKDNEDREPSRHYAIKIRPFAFADIEHRGKSIKEVRGKGIKGMTYTEMLVLHLFVHYLADYADYASFTYNLCNTTVLDRNSITLCSGSHPGKALGESPDFEIHCSHESPYVNMGGCRDYEHRDWWGIREVITT